LDDVTWHALSLSARPRLGLADVAGHVIGCHLYLETWVPRAFDDVVGNVSQAVGESVRG